MRHRQKLALDSLLLKLAKDFTDAFSIARYHCVFRPIDRRDRNPICKRFQ